MFVIQKVGGLSSKWIRSAMSTRSSFLVGLSLGRTAILPDILGKNVRHISKLGISNGGTYNQNMASPHAHALTFERCVVNNTRSSIGTPVGTSTSLMRRSFFSKSTSTSSSTVASASDPAPVTTYHSRWKNTSGEYVWYNWPWYIIFLTQLMILFGGTAGIIALFPDETTAVVSTVVSKVMLKVSKDNNLAGHISESIGQVLYTLANDDDVMKAVSTFMGGITKDTPMISENIHLILKGVLEHEDNGEALSLLFQKLLQEATRDPKTMKDLANLLSVAIADPVTQKAASELVVFLSRDSEVYDALVILFAKVTGESAEMQLATNRLLTDASTIVLTHPQILANSQQFVSDVMSDDLISQVAGDAIVATAKSAAYMGSIKAIGIGIIGISLTLLGVVSSPY